MCFFGTAARRWYVSAQVWNAVCQLCGVSRSAAAGWFLLWGVPVFLANVSPSGGGRFYFFTLAFPPIYEKITPVDFLAESGNGIGRDLVEDGGYVTVGFCVKDRFIRGGDG